MNHLPATATTTTVSDAIGGIRRRVKDWKMLVKFRLTLTVIFSSVMAYLIASPATVNWLALVILAMGGFLTTGAANVLNQVLEKDYDRLMRRTADRPLAAGRMKMADAVLAAGFMSLFGISLLALFNPWAAFFGMFALVSYAFVYTPMKRVSPDAVTIGAIPGALPVLIGCVAAQGTLTWLGLVLFAIQFFWQFPHFWSIGFLGYEDYSRAGYKLVPERDGRMAPHIVGRQAVICTVILTLLGGMPALLGVCSWPAALLVMALGMAYTYFAWQFYRQAERRTALRLMFFSFVYIPLALMVIWIAQLV